jgi:hypothetical protein
MRLHPAIISTLDQADCDDIVPLENPVRLKNGSMANHIPIKKGTMIIHGLGALVRGPADSR